MSERLVVPVPSRCLRAHRRMEVSLPRRPTSYGPGRLDAPSLRRPSSYSPTTCIVCGPQTGSTPQAQKPYQRADHFNGGGSTRAGRAKGLERPAARAGMGWQQAVRFSRRPRPTRTGSLRPASAATHCSPKRLRWVASRPSAFGRYCKEVDVDATAISSPSLIFKMFGYRQPK